MEDGLRIFTRHFPSELITAVTLGLLQCFLQGIQAIQTAWGVALKQAEQICEGDRADTWQPFPPQAVTQEMIHEDNAITTTYLLT